MCARCLKEGGDVDFTSVPKRKKKGRPVMMMAYVPTAEEEQQALELDRTPDEAQVVSTQAQTATRSSDQLHISVSGEEITGGEEVVGATGLAENTPAAATTANDAPEPETGIEGNTLATTSEEQAVTGRTYHEVHVRAVKTDHLSSNPTSVTLVIGCTDNTGDELDEKSSEDSAVAAIVKGSQVFVFEASLVRLAAADFSISELLEVVLPAIQTAPAAEEKPVVTLCCVGFELSVVVALWNSGEGKLGRLCVVDPPPLMEPTPTPTTLTGATHVVPRPVLYALPSSSTTSESSGSASIGPSTSLSDCSSDGDLYPAARSLVGAGVRYLSSLPQWTSRLPMLRVSFKAAQLILESLGRMVSPPPPSIARGGRYEEDGEQVCSSESTSREAPAPTSRAGSYYEVFYSPQYNFGPEDNSESATLQHLHFLDGNLVPVVRAEDGGVAPL